MLKIGIKVNLDPNFSRTMKKKLGTFVEHIMSDVQTIAAQKTPRRSGAAAHAWKELGTGVNTTVVNDKPYIGVLDKGRHMTNRGMRGSTQAPRGITGPTIKEIRRKYK